MMTHVTGDLRQPPQTNDHTEEESVVGLETEGDSSKHGESKLESPKVSEAVVADLDMEQQKVDAEMKRKKEDEDRRRIRDEERKQNDENAGLCMDVVGVGEEIRKSLQQSLPENSSSSSDESENDEDSSTTRQEVSVGTGSALSGKPRQFTTTVVAKHYKLLANSSFVKVFYAEASNRKNIMVKVYGHWVHYHASTINQFLGLKTPDSCAFATLMQEPLRKMRTR
ncbi:hypothetical protein L6452_22429 [Arctium lappa]|uniref:Uncharacterized protein n=1 Tax=Arctium lappa TaxID=4217 RepID=A0ACB9AYY6_ARCLA|nr:hypothetical protein L6452_22429 [Arctium lappa]